MNNDKIIDVLFSITNVLDRINTEISSEWVDFSKSIEEINDSIREIQTEYIKKQEILENHYKMIGEIEFVGSDEARKWRDMNNR